MPVVWERLGATRLGTNLGLIYWTLDGLHQVTWPQTAWDTLPMDHLQQVAYWNPKYFECLTSIAHPHPQPLMAGFCAPFDSTVNFLLRLINMCRRQPTLWGSEKHTTLRISGVIPEINRSPWTQPSLMGLKGRHTILIILPQKTVRGVGISLEKIWESFRIPSEADWWRHSSPKES